MVVSFCHAAFEITSLYVEMYRVPLTEPERNPVHFLRDAKLTREASKKKTTKNKTLVNFASRRKCTGFRSGSVSGTPYIFYVTQN